ncbi:alpha/beta fold hydrolase, partial [Methylorubrum zatmanii]
LDRRIAPDLLVAINGALTPFPGIANILFPSIARVLFLNPITPKVFAWSADRAAVRRLIDGTGSRLDPQGLDLYRRLFTRPGHVSGALGMMANWDLPALSRDLPGLTTRTLLIVGGDDKAIKPEDAFTLRERLPNARVELLRGLGHLAHEEAPERVAGLILAEAETAQTATP